MSTVVLVSFSCFDYCGLTNGMEINATLVKLVTKDTLSGIGSSAQLGVALEDIPLNSSGKASLFPKLNELP